MRKTRRDQRSRVDFPPPAPYFTGMAIREILTVPDPRLKEVSKPVEGGVTAPLARAVHRARIRAARAELDLVVLRVVEALERLEQLGDARREPGEARVAVAWVARHAKNAQSVWSHH